MNVRPWIFTPIWMLGALALPGIAASPLLYLQDGDIIPGEIREIKEGGPLVWKAPFFTGTMSIPSPQIDTIQFPSTRIQFPTGKGVYQVLTVQGDSLHGQLLRITPEHVKLETKRHGLVTLLRSQVASLQHLQGHWLHSAANQAKWVRGEWYRKTGQHLATNIRSARISDTFEFFQPFHFHIKLSFPARPKFLLSFKQQGGALKPGIGTAVETWDDHLVLIHNKQFTSLGTLSDDDNQVELHLYIDPSSSSASAYDGGFNFLGALEGNPGSKSEKFDFRLQNRADSMGIENLEATKWHGKPPATAGSAPMVIGSDGNSIHGHLHSFDAKGETLFIPGRPVVEVGFFGSANFSPLQQEYSPPKGTVTLVFNDTTRLVGKLDTLTRSMARIQIPASKDPIQCNLSDVSRIQWHNPPLPTQQDSPSGEDLLSWKSGYLQGKVLATDKAGAPLAWKPAYGGPPLTLDMQATYSIERAGFLAEPYLSEVYPAMLHLSNRMEIPAKLEGFSPDKLSISSPFLPGKQELPNSSIRAIRFPTKDKSYIGKGTWSLHNPTRNLAETEGDIVTLTGETLFYAKPNHRSVLDFQIQNLREAEFMITIYNPENLEEHTKVFTNTPSSYLRMHKQGSDRDFNIRKVEKHSTETHYVYNRRRTTAKIQLVFDDIIRVKVNGDSQSTLNYNPDHPVAVHILPQGSSQNLVLQSNELSRASVAFPAPADLSKTLALPRLVAKSPPPHIITAHNGDILRGKLLRIVAGRMEFRSMKRRLNIPVERCSAILWMDPPGEQPPSSIPQEISRVVLSNGLVLPITPKRFEDGRLIGTSETLGECQTPLDSISAFHFGKSGFLDPLPTFDPWQYTVNAPIPLD